MNQPTLIVEGKRHAVLSITWVHGEIESVDVMKNGVYTRFYNMNMDHGWHIEESLLIDFSKHLIDEEQLTIVTEISTAIDKMIEDKSKELTGMSLEHTEACLKYPHSDDSLLQEYALLKREQIGLIKAQEVIESYMTEDVDLSGGSE